MTDALTPFERRFLDSVDHHLKGLEEKVQRDFSVEALAKEVAALQGDPVYSGLGFDTAEYALVRLVGRMSISVGRRLGEIYDKVPRFVAAARFGLQAHQIAEVFGGLELDISLRKGLLKEADQRHIDGLIAPMRKGPFEGVGIEIRYNFNPNDSSRLRKDVDVCERLEAEGLLPVYLIFSSISPRSDAIARLTRAGWLCLQGSNAIDFLTNLLGVDIAAVLADPAIRRETRARTQDLMRSIFYSEAFASLGTQRPAVA